MTLPKFLSFLLLGSISFMLSSCGGDDNAPAPPPTISAPTVTGLFQPEGQLTITFSITGTFKEGNVFTAQLSDGTGGFTNPVAIGTLASLTAGTITATLPASAVNGTAYRIRVVANSPSTIGSDNGANLSIAAPTLSIASFNTAPQADVTYIGGRQVAMVTSSTGTFASNNVFKIQLSDASGSFTNATTLYEGATLSATQTVTLPTNITPGSGYKFRLASTNPVVTSTPTAAFNVVSLAFSAPTITGNVVLGGTTTVTVNITNGPLLPGELKVELSDANGSFDSPTQLANIQNPTSTSQSFAVTLGTTLAPGAGYKIRAVTNGPDYTGPASAAFSIGALPTLTIAEANPVFTRMYSAQANATGLSTYYVFNVQGSGSFNPNTTFVFEVASPGQAFGTPPTISYSALTAATLTANGTVTAAVGLRNAPTGAVTFRVRANGHSVASNEKTYTVYPTAVTALTGSVDNVSYNFNTAPTVSTNASVASGANNQTISLAGDAAYNLHGATKLRAYVGLALTNEVVATGSRNVSVTMQLLSSTGQLVAAYSNASVSTTITGNATDGYSATIGAITLTKFGTGTGPATLTMQNGSFSFKME